MSWLSLLVATAATMLTRLAGAGLARSKIFNKLDEQTLSRLFPLAILFCLVFKELASAGAPANVGVGLVSVAVVVALHLWKRTLFISVLGGTAFHAAALALLR